MEIVKRQAKMFIRIILCIMIASQFLYDPVLAQEDSMVSCRSTIDCNATAEDEIGIMTARECCLETPEGLSYIVSDQRGGQTCTICIVFGFFQDVYTGMEQWTGHHSVPVGYQKGAFQVEQNLVFDVHDSPGTATNGDYTITTRRVRVLHLAPDTRDNVVLYFKVDNIAQERNETLTLNLSPIEGTALPTGDGVFFRNNITIIITDSDTLDISFTEGDYRANERDTSMPVKVIKNALIATSVELEVIPLTIQQSMGIIPSSLRDGIPEENSYSPPFADVADFNNTTITITFDPDEGESRNELNVPVPIFDDRVNEANEQVFVVQLKLVGGANMNSVTISRQVSLCRIIDDDVIRIGFEQPSYTYMEPMFETTIDKFFTPHSGSPVNGPIYLAKEDNGSSEQTFSVVIQVASPSNSGQNIQPAMHNEDYSLSVSQTYVTLSFLPNDQRIDVPFTLFADDISEGTEAFHLSSAPNSIVLPDQTRVTLPTYFNPIHLSTDTTIIIEESKPSNVTTEPESTTTITTTTTSSDTATGLNLATATDASTTESDGTTTGNTTLTTDVTQDGTDDVTSATGSGSYGQTTTNTDTVGGTSTTDIEQSTTATATVTSTLETANTSAVVFNCSAFTQKLEIILHSTMELQRLNQHNISMAIERLAQIIADTDIDGCLLEQIRVNLNVISDIISNVAQFVLNKLSTKTIDSRIVYGSTKIVNTLLQWPAAAVKVEASSSLIRSYEIISAVYARQLSINDVQNFTFPSIILVTQLSTVNDLQSSGKTFIIGDITKFTVTESTPRAVSSLETISSSPSENVNSSIHLPGSVFQQTGSSKNTTGLVFTLYKASTLFPVSQRAKSNKNSSMTEVGTHIIAANINGQDIEGLKDPVIITLQLNIREGVFLMPGSETCVFWDFNLQDWTDRGCKTSVGQNGTITCSCSHLTNFAVLMDVCLRQEDCKPVNKDVDTVLSFISYIGIAVSIIGLLLTIITMLAFKKVRQRETSKYHIQLCIALILMLVMALVLVATSAQAVDSLYGGCVFISVFVHYFALVAVMWMGAEALLMLQKVVIIFVRITTKYVVILSLICWLAPILPVFITLVVDLATGHELENDIIVKRAGDTSFCFLSHAGAFWGAFLAPILLIIIFNIIAFICVIFVLVRQVRRRAKATMANEEAQKMGYKKIIFLMIRISGVMALFGLTWLFAILTVVSVTGLQETFQILFTIFNSFQGCFIFIFLCVLDQKVRELWKHIYMKIKSRLLPKKLKSAKKYPSSDMESTTNGTALHTRYSFISSRQATLMSLNAAEGVCTDSKLA